MTGNKIKNHIKEMETTTYIPIKIIKTENVCEKDIGNLFYNENNNLLKRFFIISFLFTFESMLSWSFENLLRILPVGFA